MVGFEFSKVALAAAWTLECRGAGWVRRPLGALQSCGVGGWLDESDSPRDGDQ